MKRISIILILGAITNVLCAQNTYDFQYSIAYDMYINFGSRILSKSLLNYSNTVSCFTYKASEDYSTTKSEEGSDEQNIELNDTITRRIWCDKDLNEIMEINNIGPNKYLIVDSIPQLKWEILDETREIEGFSCNKAKCKFRGRTYTAWFTLYIPCNWGPWKLHGLPGAILEAYDETNEVSFYATNIKREKITMKRENVNSYERITHKEYIEKFEKNFSEGLKRGLSKTSPGLQIKVSKVKIKKIELEYE